MFKSIKHVVLTAFALATSASIATAAPITVDLSDAQTSVSNAGSAMIGIAVLILGLILVIKFLRKG